MSDQTPPTRRRRGKAADKAPAADKPTVPKGRALAPDEDITEPAPRPRKFPPLPQLRRGFQTVVNDLYADGYDVMEEYELIKQTLKLDSDALTPDHIKREANRREDMAFRAHRLHAVAEVEVAAFRRETEGTYGAIRDEAIQHMEQQKATKVRTKQITDTDAISEASRMFPDEWAAVCSRRLEAEMMLKTLKRLAELCDSRCHTVRKMIPDNRSV